MKESMLEAIKRKKYAIQHTSEDVSEHSEGEGAHDGDKELAPASGSAKHDALMGGKPVTEGEPGDARPAEHQNIPAEGQRGFDSKSEGKTAPENSRDLFQNVKKDTHDPVDLNADRNMAGDGSNSKYDKMGVDEHEDVRGQSSLMARANAKKNEMLKEASRAHVKDSLALPKNGVSSGEEAGKDNPDASPDEQMQPGFPAPKSKVNRTGSKSILADQDKEGASDEGGLYSEEGDEHEDGDAPDASPKKKLKGFKAVHAKMNAMFSKKA